MKRWSVDDFEQGHSLADTRHRAANRREVLGRLRRRVPPLPADLANGWDYFLRRWDVRRVVNLNQYRTPAWGTRFVNIMVELQERMWRDAPGARRCLVDAR